MNYDQSLPSEMRKQEGIFYTPVFLAKVMVFDLLESWFSEKEKEVLIEKTDFGLAYFHKILTIKFLDPACGTGDFLKPAFEILCEKLKEILLQINDYQTFSYDYENYLLENCLFGVDIDAQAVEICRKTLKIKHIRVGNSLISDPKIDAKAFVWEKEFSEIFAAGGFDRVVANPPYVSFQNNMISKKSLKYFTENYQSIFKIFDLFGIFIEKSIKFLLKTNGKLSFICPSVLLMNESFAKLRKMITEEGKFINVTFLADGVFEEAVVPTITFTFHKNTQKANVEIGALVEKTKFIQKNIIDYDWFYQNPQRGFNIKLLRKDGLILNKITQNTFNLGEILEIREAIKTGNDKKFIANNKINRQYLPLVTGRDIHKYQLKQSRFILFDEKLLERATKKEYFLQEKLFIRRVSSSLIATYDNQNLFATHVLYLAFVKENQTFHLKFLLALLNSKLWNYVYAIKFPAKGNIFPEIRIGNLRELPVKNISVEDQQIFIDLVSQILSLKSQQKDTSALENQVDDLVYKLYDLTEEEIQFIENQ